MAETEVKTQNNQLINWMAYRKGELEEIEDLKEAIKNKTETERAKLKAHRKNVSVATWKIDELMNSLEEQVETEETVETVLTLDDFDIDGKSINIGLATKEYKDRNKEDDE